MSYPHVLLDHVQLILLLLGEELKSYKFFSTLRSIGLDDAFFQSDLGSFILVKVGLDEDSNEVQDRYYHLLAQYSEPLQASEASVRECAFSCYLALVAKA
ncbi:hypothetical protein SanaruYs_03290 [Chryseotalea sanaruensis]|uniref:Uncharacterized protein n=1 Tax=Chryseotalea sanaruensis TaxID=2482724 RepID=A0A401U567_9BACT|nr:hypothetical protein [Chryseotalea sanaruensis]GCC50114.1 hypothetical protein SanaruYs_03290 [Chryseotalea sanaruensis]